MGEDSAWSPCILSDADNICYVKDFSYAYDRRDPNTLVGRRMKMSKEELLTNRRDLTLFYLENGNPERIGLLKTHAGQDLTHAGNDAYEKLWQQIQEEF